MSVIFMFSQAADERRYARRVVSWVRLAKMCFSVRLELRRREVLYLPLCLDGITRKATVSSASSVSHCKDGKDISRSGWNGPGDSTVKLPTCYAIFSDTSSPRQ